MRDSRIVVVGGSGFIGSRLAIALSLARAAVVVADRRAPPPDLPAACEVHLVDVTRPGELDGVVRGARTVFLLAAHLAKRCEANPAAALRTNVEGTENVLRSILKTGTRPRVVFMSSGSVYSRAARYPVDEEGETEAATVYAASKLAGEALVRAAAASGGLTVVVLRPFTVYGPGPASGARGHFVADWIERASTGRPVTVHGDGRQTVDLTHVTDLVAACGLAARLPLEPGETKVFNVGSGRETAVAEVAVWIRDVLPSVRIRFAESPRRVPPRQCADLRLATDVLGYSPRVAPEDGIKDLLSARLRRPAHKAATA
jgi:nucleoside-diphosphate-sugar epimerase